METGSTWRIHHVKYFTLPIGNSKIIVALISCENVYINPRKNLIAL